MRIQALQQCDLVEPGKGHPASRRRALFPEQVYEFNDEALAEVQKLVKAGAVKLLKEERAATS